MDEAVIAQRTRRDAGEHEADAHGELDAELVADLLLLLGGVEVLHEGVGALEGGIVHARGDDERDACDDAREQGAYRKRVDGNRPELDPVEQGGEGKAEKDEGHARRDAVCELDLVLVIARDVGERGGRGNRLRRLRHASREIARDELVEGAVEDLGELDELVHLGVGALCLPLGDGLAGNAHQHGKLLLGHVARGAEVLEVVAEAHGRAFLLVPICLPAPSTVW